MKKSKKGIQIKQIIQQEDLQIKKVYNKRWAANFILHSRAQRPGLALAGYDKYLDRERIQIFGKTEIGYIEFISSEEKEKRLVNFFAKKLCGILVSENLNVSKRIIQLANRSQTPIMISTLRTSLLLSRISTLLSKYFSKIEKAHGVLMDIFAQGVLITGESGIGKSETALGLVKKGHPLIADDVIEFYLNTNDDPVGRSSDITKSWMEVRGLGIVNICDIFGMAAVLPEKKLDLVINLEKWDPKKSYDRLGEESMRFRILGVDIPMINLPVAPGRNISTLIEIAVQYSLARKSGAKSFLEVMDQQGKKREKKSK